MIEKLHSVFISQLLTKQSSITNISSIAFFIEGKRAAA